MGREHEAGCCLDPMPPARGCLCWGQYAEASAVASRAPAVRAVPSPAPCRQLPLRCSSLPCASRPFNAGLCSSTKDLRRIQRAATDRETLAELSFKPYLHPRSLWTLGQPLHFPNSSGAGQGDIACVCGQGCTATQGVFLLRDPAACHWDTSRQLQYVLRHLDSKWHLSSLPQSLGHPWAEGCGCCPETPLPLQGDFPGSPCSIPRAYGSITAPKCHSKLLSAAGFNRGINPPASPRAVD